MTSINHSKSSVNSTKAELSIGRSLYQRVSWVMAAGMSLGLVAITTTLTNAVPTSAVTQSQTSSHSPMLLAQKVNQNEVLTAHNKYRQQVGVSALKWSDSLARSAQQWANRLASTDQLQHSSTNYGENLWAGSKGRFSQKQMVDSWGSEKQYFLPNRPFPNSCKGGWQKCGHYTQIIWKNTKEVGCGLARNKSIDYFFCQYNPSGNYEGEKPY